MEVLEVLKEKYKSSKGQGMYVPMIAELSGLDWFEVKKQLNLLYKDGKINISEGINGKLVSLKKYE